MCRVPIQMSFCNALKNKLFKYDMCHVCGFFCNRCEIYVEYQHEKASVPLSGGPVLHVGVKTVQRIRLEEFNLSVSESKYSICDTVSVSEYSNHIFMMSISNRILSDIVETIPIRIQTEI